MTLNAISWSFNDKNYTDYQEFNKEIIKYQEAIHDNSASWKPDEVIINAPEIQIQYMAWITSLEDLKENEVLIDDDKDVFEEYPDEEEHQVEIIATLKADNKAYFTALEFLMKVHNQQSNKELGDHIFFEGIDETPEIINGLATYYIACGS